MRLSADVNASSNSTNNVPVVLFCYGESRKFVRVSGDYEETLHAICRAFDIPTKNTSTISLTTSALEVCKGREVVIDESAYPLMWNFLDEMTISVYSDANVSDGITKGKGKAKETVASSSSRTKQALAEPKPHLSTPSTQEEEEQQEPAARKPDTFQDDLLDFTSDHQQEQEAEVEEEQPWGERHVEEPVTARAASPDLYSRERERHQEEEEDQEEERLPVSRTVKKFKKPEPVAGSSSSRATDDTFLQVKQERDADATDTSEFSSRRERERERNPKKEAAQNLGPADDPRFEITIISPESTCAQFKTRGKHQVRKVLAAACKTFGIDPSRTQLVMRLELDGDDDEFHDFVCSPSETISGCGVTYNSKLFLKEIPEEDLD